MQKALTLKDLTLTRRIGAGAFGEVHIGAYLSTPVAVKIIRPEVGTAALESDLKAMVTLRHPHVVAFISSGPNFIVMEKYDTSLAGLLEGRLPDRRPGEVVSLKDLHTIATHASRGLLYMRHHFDACFSHNDLKPDNLLVKTFGGSIVHVSLGDVGLANVCSKNPGGFVGTPGYMPEAYSSSADLKALVVTLLNAYNYPMTSYLRISDQKTGSEVIPDTTALGVSPVPRPVAVPMRTVLSLPRAGFREDVEALQSLAQGIKTAAANEESLLGMRREAFMRAWQESIRVLEKSATSAPPPFRWIRNVVEAEKSVMASTLRGSPRAMSVVGY